MREGGTGGPDPPPPPLKNHKNIGFLNNICSDTLKNHKASKPALNVGSSWACQQKAISMAFCWRADDSLLIVVFGSSLPSSAQNKQEKNVVKFGPPLTKLWIRACSNRIIPLFSMMRVNRNYPDEMPPYYFTSLHLSSSRLTLLTLCPKGNFSCLFIAC